MALSIKRDVVRDDPTSPRLWTVLTTGPFAHRWIGRLAPAAPGLNLSTERPTLLYFRTRGCTVCTLVDMQVAQACHQASVDLLIIDRYAKSDDPADRIIYDQPGNLLDKGGVINEQYAVGVYPTFVLVNPDHRIVLKDVGAKAKPEVFKAYLDEQFRRAQ